MDKFSELKAVAEKAKELAGINNYKKGKDAIVAFKAAANPAAILAMLAELEAKDKRIAELEASETQLIQERDSTEQALADMYEAATGERPEWSNWFGFADAIEEVAQVRAKLANREAQTVVVAWQHKGEPWRIILDRDIEEVRKSSGSWSPLFTAPPAPANANAVAWEMRYWNNGHNMWHDWERITAEQHAEMSVQHAADNDYEFRVLYDSPPAPAVPDELRNAYKAEGISEVLKEAREYAPLTAGQWEALANNWHQTFVGLSGDANCCRPAMLKGERP